MGLCGSAAAVRVGNQGNVGYSTRRLDNSIRKPANAESDMIALLQRLPDIDEWAEKMTNLKLGNPPKIFRSFNSSDELHCNFRNFCKYGHVEDVSELLQGSAVDFWCLHGSQKFNETALVLAAKYGQHEVVKLLVSHGAEINYLANGGTALHWACKSYSQDNYARMEPQQVATVQYLLGEGAEMCIGKYDAFHMAVSRGSVPMILLLRATGAEITSEVNEAAKKWGGAVSRAVLGEEKISVPYCAPDYWSHQKNESVLEHVEETAVLPLFQAAVTSTFKAVRTRDRKGAAPQRLRLKKAFRIENSQLWQRFQNASAALERRRGSVPGCTEVQMLDGNPETGHVKTSEPLGELTQRLRKPLVEHYLFHGTSPENAKAIAANGFRRIMAGSNAGTAFGRGCYFAEASSKSDEYAQCDEQGQFVILLCRVEFPALAALSKCFRRSGETSRIRPWLYAGADVGWQSRDWPRENQSLVLQSMAPGVSEKMWYSPKPWHSTASQQLAAGSSNCWKPAATFQPKRAKNLSWSLDLSAAVRSWRPLIVLAISVLEHYGLLRVSH